jgi:hypothetical protein
MPTPGLQSRSLPRLRGRVGVGVIQRQYGLELELPAPGLAAAPVRISCTAAAAPIVTKRVSPPTVTKVKPISIAFSA